MFVTSKSSNELQIICVYGQCSLICVPSVPETALIKYNMKPTELPPSLIQHSRNSCQVQLFIQSRSLSFLQVVLLQKRVEVGKFVSEKIKQSNGLVYIHDYNIPDIDDNDSELKKEHSLSVVQKATWIKTKNITSAPLLLTFKKKEPIRPIEISE